MISIVPRKKIRSEKKITDKEEEELQNYSKYYTNQYCTIHMYLYCKMLYKVIFRSLMYRTSE